MNMHLIPDLSSRELQAVCTIAEEGGFLAVARNSSAAAAVPATSCSHAIARTRLRSGSHNNTSSKHAAVPMRKSAAER